MVKTNGAEWKQFLNDESYWDELSVYEDELITVDGIEGDVGLLELSDKSKLTITGGIIKSDDPDLNGASLEEYFKNWRKKQNTTILIVTVQKDSLEKVKAAVIAAGGKVK